MAKVNYITYKCSKCGETDVVKMFSDEGMPPLALNCGKCHAGFKMDPANMIQSHIGMFPTVPIVQSPVAH